MKQNERLQKQVSHLKERELTLTSETKSLKEDLSKKASMLIKMKEDKMRGTTHMAASGENVVGVTRK